MVARHLVLDWLRVGWIAVADLGPIHGQYSLGLGWICQCECIKPEEWKMRDLQELVKRAVERFDAMPVDQQREHRRAQRKSWVVGETMLSHPEMSREEAERLYDQVILELGLHFLCSQSEGIAGRRFS